MPMPRPPVGRDRGIGEGQGASRPTQRPWISAAAADQGGARNVLAAQAEAGELGIALGGERVVAGGKDEAVTDAVGEAVEEAQDAAAASAAAGGKREGESAHGDLISVSDSNVCQRIYSRKSVYDIVTYRIAAGTYCIAKYRFTVAGCRTRADCVKLVAAEG